MAISVPTNVIVKSNLVDPRLIVQWDLVVGAVSYNVFRGLSADVTSMRLVSVTQVDVVEEAVIRGGTDFGSDALIAADVFAIKRVGLTTGGSTGPDLDDFLDGADYVLLGNKVDWRMRNRQPVAGQTYYVDYVRRDTLPVPAPITLFTDTHAHQRIRTEYWYAVQAVAADNSVSDLSIPVTLVFTATDRNTRNFNMTLERR